MNKKIIISMIASLCLSVFVSNAVFADFSIVSPTNGIMEQMQDSRGMQHGRGMHPGNGMMPESGMQPREGQTDTQNIVTEPGTIVTSTAVNTASKLEADLTDAVRITVSDSDGQIKIDEPGTYVISGTSSDGNITVKKGTEGVVLVLEDLDLTSHTGAAVSINKDTEVKVIISGTVILTDDEDPADEFSTDQAAADAFDGAALKAKAGSMVYITGDGILNIIGKTKNGIKSGDESSLVLDGPTVQIAAVNDGINSNFDLSLLSGTIAVSTGDDGIHAEHILTIGRSDGTGPAIYISKCSEGLEASVVNIFGGDITINASDDAVNAANKNGLYRDELTYSINMTGGNVTINGQGDGFDANGNINLIGGSATVNVQYRMGEAGIDYDGAYYISDNFQLNNAGGVSGPDNMGGGRGGWGRP